MKKWVSIILAFLVMMSGSLSFAASQGKGSSWKATESQRTVSLDELLSKLGDYYKDPEHWRELIREVMAKKIKDKDTSLRVIVKGKEIKDKNEKVIKFNGIVLPVNPIKSGMGANVTWKSPNITITKGNITIILTLDKKGANVKATVKVGNGTESTVTLDIRKGNKAGIILKFIAQTLGYDAQDYGNGLIIIDDKKTATVNDNSTGTGLGQFQYSTNWSYGPQSKAYRNDNHWSAVTGESFQVVFNGTQIKLYGAKASNHGIAAVSIDGGKEVLVDYYAAKRKDNTLVYVSPALTSGQHTLKVRVTGTHNEKASGNTITADRVDIFQSTVTIPANDVASKKVSTSDSQQPQNPAALGNDGSLDTRWCAADGGANHWWMVDLGGLYTLSGSEVNWEFDGKLYCYKIETSSDGTNWQTVIDKTHNTDTHKVQVDNFSAIATRYVRITVTGMQAGTWASFWDFKVFGVPTTADSAAPSVPAGLKATAVSQDKINLTWKASSDNTAIAGYKVFRNGQQVAVVTLGTSYLDTGLTPATAYVYTVAAFDSTGNTSAQSAIAYAITNIVPGDGQAPTVPTELVATAASSTQVNLSWKAATDNIAVVGYKVYRNGTLVAQVTTGTTYSDTGLTANNAYVYTVAAYDAAGNTSDKSGAAYAIPLVSSDTQVPTVPTGLTASTFSPTQVNLTWTVATDNIAVVGYKVYRNDQQIATVTGNTYSDTGLVAATTYTYTIAAYDAAGNTSAKCTPVAVTTPSLDTQAPSVPTGLAATAVYANQIILHWTASTDNVAVTSYKVYRNSVLVATVTTGTVYTDTGLTANTTYSYVVKAFDAAGNVSECPALSVTTLIA